MEKQATLVLKAFADMLFLYMEKQATLVLKAFADMLTLFGTPDNFAEAFNFTVRSEVIGHSQWYFCIGVRHAQLVYTRHANKTMLKKI